MRDDVLVTVISAGRPGNVTKLREALDCDLADLLWCVPPYEVGEYRAYGAKAVETGGLVESRNFAIDYAAAEGFKWNVQLSDDLARLRYFLLDGEGKQPLTLADAVDHMLIDLEAMGGRLAGVAPTDNTFFYNKPFHTDAFIVGDFMVIDTASTPRFDPALKLKEDYDFTLQHLKEYGIALRCNRMMPTFLHRKNRGGAVAYRTEELEQEAIAYLKAKWPDNIRDNPRRPNEVLLRWK